MSVLCAGAQLHDDMILIACCKAFCVDSGAQSAKIKMPLLCWYCWSIICRSRAAEALLRAPIFRVKDLLWFTFPKIMEVDDQLLPQKGRAFFHSPPILTFRCWRVRRCGATPKH